ncbi:Histidinol-phosphatase [alternative form] [hydrothermal vent metagenome]|uniref:histidinol-phosphatase n=1 Tax=hydrothermal vent metagenome TaxID=652676 RepID=A0A3B0SAQ9_9ZZZZ
MTKITEFEALLERLADAAGAQILPYFRTNLAIDNKLENDGFDPVTLADRAGERVIRDMIKQAFPDHGIRGEEYGTKPANSRYCWVIDPIDGTRAFISGLPVWGVLIALLEDGEPVLGLMDQPFTGERFLGGPKGAVFCHQDQQTPMQVRACPDLATATLSTTDPNLFVADEVQVFENLRRRTRLQRYGLDCYAYATLAMGGMDIVVETGLQDYDICALIPVVQAAGGQITTWSGKPAQGGGQVLATGDHRLHEQALAILSDAAQD